MRGRDQLPGGACATLACVREGQLEGTQRCPGDLSRRLRGRAERGQRRTGSQDCSVGATAGSLGFLSESPGTAPVVRLIGGLHAARTWSSHAKRAARGGKVAGSAGRLFGRVVAKVGMLLAEKRFWGFSTCWRKSRRWWGSCEQSDVDRPSTIGPVELWSDRRGSVGLLLAVLRGCRRFMRAACEHDRRCEWETRAARAEQPST